MSNKNITESLRQQAGHYEIGGSNNIYFLYHKAADLVETGLSKEQAFKKLKAKKHAGGWYE